MPLAIIGYFLREDRTGNNSYVVFDLRGKKGFGTPKVCLLEY